MLAGRLGKSTLDVEVGACLTSFLRGVLAGVGSMFGPRLDECPPEFWFVFVRLCEECCGDKVGDGGGENERPDV